MTPAPTIADMINAKRASGFDGELEAILRQPFYCPHCKAGKSILDTAFNPKVPGEPLACRDCDKPGIELVKGDYVKLFRRLLDKLEPFDRSGTA